MADVAALERYFAPPKGIGTPLKVIGVGAVVFLIGFGAGPVAILLGLLIIAAGAFWIYNNKKPSGVSDSEVQAVIDQAAAPALKDAYNRFGLVQEALIADPVVLVGQNFRSQAKKGDDGEWRTAGNVVNVLLFSEKSVHLYRHQYNVLKPNEKSGQTEEYFYRHIVSVSTSEEEFDVSVGDDKIKVREDLLLLRNSGGEPIKLSAYNSDRLNAAVSSARSVIQERQD